MVWWPILFTFCFTSSVLSSINYQFVGAPSMKVFVLESIIGHDQCAKKRDIFFKLTLNKVQDEPRYISM